MFKIEELVPAEMPILLLAESFREFYERSPWNEYLRCPICSPPGDFGPAGRYGNSKLECCPVCSSTLEQYWSDVRVKEYFETASKKPGFFGVVGKNYAGDVVAWSWAYNLESVHSFEDAEPGGCYVDVIGVLPEYRDEGGSELVAIEGHMIALQKGFQYFVTRTHADAVYVHKYMAGVGYRFLRASVEEPDREYWTMTP